MSATINKILTIDIGRNTTNKIENSGEVVFPKFRTLSPNENRLKFKYNVFEIVSSAFNSSAPESSSSSEFSSNL